MQDALKREKEALEASEKQREAIEVLEQKLKATEEEKKGLVDETSRLKIESAQWEEALDRLQVHAFFTLCRNRLSCNAFACRKFDNGLLCLLDVRHFSSS